MSGLPILITSGFMLGLAGCLPTGVAWLPDSSGFYYTDRKTNAQLHFFDVKAKKSVVVAKNTNTNCAWPAISSDGKRIALANAVTPPEIKGLPRLPTTIEIAIFDNQGQETKRTKRLTLAASGFQSIGIP